MKTLFFLLSFVPVSVLASTRLEIKLEGFYFKNNREYRVNVPALNKQLKKLGLDGLPEVIQVSTKPVPYWKLLQKRIKAANQALDREMHFNIYDDGYGEGYLYKMEVCYRGEVSKVPALIDGMVGNFLNETQGILAMAAGRERVIHDEAFESVKGLKDRYDTEYESNYPLIKLWLNYDTDSDTALVFSDYGPQGDGTELEMNEITPCE